MSKIRNGELKRLAWRGLSAEQALVMQQVGIYFVRYRRSESVLQHEFVVAPCDYPDAVRSYRGWIVTSDAYAPFRVRR